MVVSSIKCCLSKFSARIRDYYLDTVDSYYRPEDEVHECNNSVLNSQTKHSKVKNKFYHHHHHQHKCNARSCAKETNKDKNNLSIVNGSNANNNCNFCGIIHNNKSTSSHKHHRTPQSSNNNNVCQNCTSPNQQQESQQNRQPITRGNNNIAMSRVRLPSGYTKKITTQGQVYYCDQEGQKYWFDPRVPKELLAAELDLDNLIGKLSTNWEVRQTGSGKTYFVNHIKKTTQFTDPRLVAYKDHLMVVLERMNYIRFHKQAMTFSQHLRNNQIPMLASGRVSNPESFIAKFSAPPNPEDENLVGREFLRTINYQFNNNNNNTNTSANITQEHSSTLTRPSTTSNKNHNNTIHDFSSRRRYSRYNQPDRTDLQPPYQTTLLSGSHHNLSTATNDTTETNHSNTLTGIPPAWFKVTYERRKKQQDQHQHQQTQNSVNISSIPNTTISNLRQRQLENLTNTTRSQQNPQLQYSTSANNSIFESKEYNQHVHINKDLSDKISILRQELLKQQVSSHPCRIDISRKRIFEESFRVISQMQPRELKKRLLVKFKGEEGLDYGGVAREWFYLLSREILNPIHGLFQYTSDDIYNLQINPDSGIVYKEHLSYLNFCGRVIGMAVFHGHFIEGHFTLPFYKMLLRKQITLADIEFVDPDLYRSLCWILENDITNVIDTTFLVQHNAFGQLQEHELKDGGRNIVVTEENKNEYVTLYVNYRCRRGIETQFEALQRGFYELIQPNLVDNFNEYELELLIGGLSKINYDDWRLHTKLKNCNVDTPLVRWFWDIVKSYGEDKRARLLQFVTGSPRVPIQGFKALQGVNSETRLFTIHLIKNACTDNLPKSHTCFNRIDLPPYETYEKLRDKLTQAIEETMGFAMQ